MGRCKDALPIFEAIVRENPRNLFALNYLAGCLSDERRFAEAVPVLERLLREGPEWASLRYNLGGCLEELGRKDEALEQYRRSLALTPDHPGTLAGLARLLRADHPAEAARHLRRLRVVTRGQGDGG
jgi:tetratricopeptide (TPR) repeat protein